ncbi:MAG TPA: UDP-N-acetylmuramoyl-L-alanine--D-glutamate ligase [Candidatus Saccharimonadales bacterium]|jgi:UDP-N-acetylmuramoylalanine--D-glutamate ligase|nr:UDP-N-acetylmuramoyl-L-alanine--D-glutamate ligase [Candidatus Saccharimonadales bacterium]
MKIALLGFDIEGRSSFEYFKAQGHQITICDRNPKVTVPEDVPTVLGENYLDNLDRFDLLVRTAGLAPQKILTKNPAVADKITTHINEFFKASPTKNLIGVTGTKGKGTTSTLITKMLEADSKHVRLGGNIGVPPLSFVSELKQDSWVVLELSSFQLIDLKYSPRIAVCLMVVPEHLDWHPDINDYTLAKSQLFTHQTDEDVAIFLAGSELSELIASSSRGHKIPYFAPPGAFVEGGTIKLDGQDICQVAELKLLGRHNWQNACAAVTAIWQITQNVEAIRSVITNFSGLEHRLELVREVDGVSYYDDSFGTAPETAIVALQAFEQPKIIILGGSDKGANYNELAKAIVAGNVRTVLLIGSQASRIQESLEKTGFTDFTPGGTSMAEIVGKAHQLAQPGDVVLLSPACASFDMFKNYKDRGEQFKQAVQALA